MADILANEVEMEAITDLFNKYAVLTTQGSVSRTNSSWLQIDQDVSGQVRQPDLYRQRRAYERRICLP